MKNNSIETLCDLLTFDVEGKRYYQDFNPNIHGDTLKPGSPPGDMFYEYIIDKVKLSDKPIIGIEVGSFLGYSAIYFAKIMKKHNINSKLICIDTWLGSPEHYDTLKLHNDNELCWVNGYPQLYHKFISNIILHNVQDIIIPVPLPSTIAYKVLRKVLKKVDIEFDFAFIDGSHEEMEVYIDLLYYNSLLKTNGVLCGDDWAWTSVKNDVEKFCSLQKKNVTLMNNQIHWFIHK